MTEQTAREAAVPAGMRVYAIGDIHGRLDLLDDLLGMIDAAEQADPGGEVKLIFLGDYVDRGPDSRGVIERLMPGVPLRAETVLLRGNHEEMMLRAFETADAFDFWASNGGLATARSYGVDVENGSLAFNDIEDVIRRVADAVPQDHKNLLTALPVTFELGDYLFVHAGVRPGVPLDRQDPQDCLFIRDAFLNYEGDFGCVVVHGHTPVEEPENLPNRIGIDTGAFFTNRLTALRLEGIDRRFLTTGKGWS